LSKQRHYGVNSGFPFVAFFLYGSVLLVRLAAGGSSLQAGWPAGWLAPLFNFDVATFQVSKHQNRATAFT
jgi:hypothetical protein